jgi:hypothetical protein
MRARLAWYRFRFGLLRIHLFYVLMHLHGIDDGQRLHSYCPLCAYQRFRQAKIKAWVLSEASKKNCTDPDYARLHSWAVSKITKEN